MTCRYDCPADATHVVAYDVRTNTAWACLPTALALGQATPPRVVPYACQAHAEASAQARNQARQGAP